MEGITIERERDVDFGCNLCRERKDISKVTFRLLGGTGHVMRLCKRHLHVLNKEIQKNK